MKRILFIATLVLTLLVGSSAFAEGVWTNTANMMTSRTGYTATLLQNGKVLTAGGWGSNGILKSAEIYDPESNLWIPVAEMNCARVNHTATLLKDGRVLIVGGTTTSTKAGIWGIAVNSAEIYDPKTNTWTSSGNMELQRTGHTATLLQNGKVLVAGGNVNSNNNLKSSELYDPISNTWSCAADMNANRKCHTATLLQNGKVLIAGGEKINWEILKSVEIYNPDKNTWQVVSDMKNAKEGHTATLLNNDKVIVIGGNNNKLDSINSVEIYDVTNDVWLPEKSMITAREYHSATLLRDGNILIAGGSNLVNGGLENVYSISAEIYNPDNHTWINAGSTDTGSISTVLLSDGRVLLSGTSSSDNTAKLYTPSDYGFTSSTFSEQVLQKLNNNTAVLCIGNNKAYANGNVALIDSTDPDVVPFIKDDRTLVPVRFIAESMGASVGWNDETSTATITLGSNKVGMTLGSNIITVNGAAKEIDVPAQTYNDRTFIPLRALVEALGKQVFWDDRGLIVISDTKNIFDTTSDKELINEVVGKFEVKMNTETSNEISTVQIETSKGTVVVQLENGKMPITVTNFTKLVNDGFYDGLTFHRVEDWVIQGGDPLGNGTGGSKDKIKLEINNDLKNVRGAIAMARTSDPNSATSQFYILKVDASWLDGQYAVFGNVLSGMEVVDKMGIGDKINSIKIID